MKKRYFDYDKLEQDLKNHGIVIEGFICNAYALNKPGNFTIGVKEPRTFKERLASHVLEEKEDYWIEIDDNIIVK